SELAPVAFSLARSSTAFGKTSNTTHSWPPRISRRTMLEPIRPKPTIPSCIRISLQFLAIGSRFSGVLENLGELFILAGNLVDRGLARDFFGTPIDEWLPEIGATDGIAHEAWHAGGNRKPFVHFSLVFASSQNDAADFVSSAASDGRDDTFAI